LSDASATGLRRDLGRAAAWAALLGTLVGAGIFRVTSDSWQLTGPSVMLGHVVLGIPVLATSVAYAVFLSTPLGRLPGGEVNHLRAVFPGGRLAFLGAWLKIIAYLGAFAFLAQVLADHVIPLAFGALDPEEDRLWVALVCLTIFYIPHLAGVRWFGRSQVLMCVLLAMAIAVLVLPGLFHIDPANYRPFFRGGTWGFLESLVPLFFAWAGFESLAQAAGEVKNSTKEVPRIFLRGVVLTIALYVVMSLVTFGVLPGGALEQSATPMVDVAASYLPGGAEHIVTAGAVLAIATSLNASLLVPSRLCVQLSADGLLPGWLGRVSPATGTPVLALTAGYAVAVLLLVTGQLSLALNIAIFALILLYIAHSSALLMLPKRRPDLEAEVTVAIGPRTRVAAALVSIASLSVLVVVQVVGDVRAIAGESLSARASSGGFTALELGAFWLLIGAALMKRR